MQHFVADAVVYVNVSHDSVLLPVSKLIDRAGEYVEPNSSMKEPEFRCRHRRTGINHD